jgi:hypothetical protein
MAFSSPWPYQELDLSQTMHLHAIPEIPPMSPLHDTASSCVGDDIQTRLTSLYLPPPEVAVVRAEFDELTLGSCSVESDYS